MIKSFSLCVIFLFAGNSAFPILEGEVDATSLKCQNYSMRDETKRNRCLNMNDCVWIEAREQGESDDTGRCNPCTHQTSKLGCVGTGVCHWLPGRSELGGNDCTLCSGRTQEECRQGEAGSYCFWNINEEEHGIKGYEGVCSQCPGYTDPTECAAAGCFWTKKAGNGQELCMDCAGYRSKANCESAGCSWDGSSNIRCSPNRKNWIIPETVPDDSTSDGTDGAGTTTTGGTPTTTDGTNNNGSRGNDSLSGNVGGNPEGVADQTTSQAAQHTPFIAMLVVSVASLVLA